MFNPRRDPDYLADIHEALQRIASYIFGLSYDNFLADHKTQDAVLRNLQVLGEAAKRVSAETRRAHPAIPWKEMAGLRDKVVHDYFGIRYDVVWTVISQELPVLLAAIEPLLNSPHS